MWMPRGTRPCAHLQKPVARGAVSTGQSTLVHVHPASVLVGPADGAAGCWVRRLDCCGQPTEGAVYLRFNPHSPGWALDSHVAGPPPCPSARTISSLPARPTGHLQFQGREELWEALLFFSELGESSFPHLAPHPAGRGGTVAFAFS